MTNVPQKIRDMWTDLYKLFDVHYTMDGTQAAWENFWNDAKDLYAKHNGNERLNDGITLVADWIADRLKEEQT